MSDLNQTFKTNGFLVMNDFYTAAQCDTLIERANELSKQYEYTGAISVFQTTEQTKTTDEYFLESGNAISFFLRRMHLTQMEILSNL